MKKATFAILCLLSIACINLLAGQEERSINKPLLHRYTNDRKVLIDNSLSCNHICIYLSNGEKIERVCYPNGSYLSFYLTPENSNSKRKHYDRCFNPTDRLIITFYNNNWSDNNGNYNDDLYEYLWSLRDELEDKGVHIIDNNLVFRYRKHRYRKQWNSSNNIWMESGTFSPLIKKGTFVELLDEKLQRGFSIDPKDIKNIEVWNDIQEVKPQ